jgi:hypothetical protein
MQAAREHRSKQSRKGLQNASASIEEVPDDTSPDVATLPSGGAKGSSRRSSPLLSLFLSLLSIHLFFLAGVFFVQ